MHDPVMLDTNIGLIVSPRLLTGMWAFHVPEEHFPNSKQSGIVDLERLAYWL
jgi:hypothetical protein